MSIDSRQQWTSTDQESTNLARALAIDCIENAGSGHPGIALSIMPILHLLYQKVMNHSPLNPNWVGRDRLILSCGHASIAQYVQLYLSGYPIEVSDLQKFRRLGSCTPGHPELNLNQGIEASTGPLGQGFAMAVGMALENKYLERVVKKKTGRDINLGITYVVASDGDIQEGISQEAASLAASNNLANLFVIYDSNQVTIDGRISNEERENTALRFESLGWNTRTVKQENTGDIGSQELIEVLRAPRAKKPTLVIVESFLAYGSPSTQNSHKSHGNLLGINEVNATKKILGIPESHPKFYVSPQQLAKRRQIQEFGVELENSFTIQNLLNEVLGDESDEIKKTISEVSKYFGTLRNMSTRKANGYLLTELQKVSFRFIGGSADLTESNGLKNGSYFDGVNAWSDENQAWNSNLKFGVREHAMTAITNGLALRGILNPFCATYLVFSDYQRPAIRMAALMQTNSVFIWTHDSILVGPDGPTHQPVEQIAALRSMPNFSVVRPGDANELISAWEKIVSSKNPTGIVLSRQELINHEETLNRGSEIIRGGYVLTENRPQSKPEVTLIATGSELESAMQLFKELSLRELSVRLVSMPCTDWFEEEEQEYRWSVIPNDQTPRIIIEAGTSFGWHKYGNENTLYLTIDDFGSSGSPEELLRKFHFNSEQLIERVLDFLFPKSKMTTF
jgi:transketolase